jgi:predicted RNA methylase
MKKKIFIAVFIFFTGFCFGVIFSDCMAQAVKGGVIIKEADKTDYTMPEVYELMQVAIALTDTSIVTNQVKMYENNVETNTAYYKEVIQKFGTYKNHPLVKKLNKSFSKSALNYVYQLQKAYNADFDDKEVDKQCYQK